MQVSSAIKIAIRYHFGAAVGFEQAIYNRLSDLLNTNAFDLVNSEQFQDINPDIYVWHIFEDFLNCTLMDVIDSLVDDIVAEFSGE